MGRGRAAAGECLLYLHIYLQGAQSHLHSSQTEASQPARGHLRTSLQSTQKLSWHSQQNSLSLQSSL